MVYFDTPWPIDYIFIKLKEVDLPAEPDKDTSEIHSEPKEDYLLNGPLRNWIEGRLNPDPDATNEKEFLMAGEGKNGPLVYRRDEFLTTLSVVLKRPVEAFVLQPEGELTTSEVHQFLAKYNK